MSNTNNYNNNNNIYKILKYYNKIKYISETDPKYQIYKKKIGLYIGGGKGNPQSSSDCSGNNKINLYDVVFT